MRRPRVGAGSSGKRVQARQSDDLILKTRVWLVVAGVFWKSPCYTQTVQKHPYVRFSSTSPVQFQYVKTKVPTVQ